jgi:hypothetical protein
MDQVVYVGFCLAIGLGTALLITVPVAATYRTPYWFVPGLVLCFAGIVAMATTDHRLDDLMQLLLGLVAAGLGGILFIVSALLHLFRKTTALAHEEAEPPR